MEASNRRRCRQQPIGARTPPHLLTMCAMGRGARRGRQRGSSRWSTGAAGAGEHTAVRPHFAERRVGAYAPALRRPLRAESTARPIAAACPGQGRGGRRRSVESSRGSPRARLAGRERARAIGPRAPRRSGCAAERGPCVFPQCPRDAPISARARLAKRRDSLASARRTCAPPSGRMASQRYGRRPSQHSRRTTSTRERVRRCVPRGQSPRAARGSQWRGGQAPLARRRPTPSHSRRALRGPLTGQSARPPPPPPVARTNPTARGGAPFPLSGPRYASQAFDAAASPVLACCCLLHAERGASCEPLQRAHPLRCVQLSRFSRNTNGRASTAGVGGCSIGARAAHAGGCEPARSGGRCVIRPRRPMYPFPAPRAHRRTQLAARVAVRLPSAAAFSPPSTASCSPSFPLLLSPPSLRARRAIGSQGPRGRAIGPRAHGQSRRRTASVRVRRSHGLLYSRVRAGRSCPLLATAAASTTRGSPRDRRR